VAGMQIGLAVSGFIACTVEAVEALTIVLAVGATRNWRAAMTGVGVALLALAVITAALGPALTHDEDSASANNGVVSWWLLPAVVVVMLTVLVWAVARSRG